jgi:hypothetical protein
MRIVVKVSAVVIMRKQSSGFEAALREMGDSGISAVA